MQWTTWSAVDLWPLTCDSTSELGQVNMTTTPAAGADYVAVKKKKKSIFGVLFHRKKNKKKEKKVRTSKTI